MAEEDLGAAESVSARREDVDVARASSGHAGWHPDQARMHLARWVLAVIAVLFLVVIIFYACSGDAAAKDIFDTAKIVFPPIVTLVLGAYFRGGRE